MCPIVSEVLQRFLVSFALEPQKQNVSSPKDMTERPLHFMAAEKQRGWQEGAGVPNKSKGMLQMSEFPPSSSELLRVPLHQSSLVWERRLLQDWCPVGGHLRPKLHLKCLSHHYSQQKSYKISLGGTVHDQIKKKGYEYTQWDNQPQIRTRCCCLAEMGETQGHCIKHNKPSSKKQVSNVFLWNL